MKSNFKILGFIVLFLLSSCNKNFMPEITPANEIVDASNNNDGPKTTIGVNIDVSQDGGLRALTVDQTKVGDDRNYPLLKWEKGAKYRLAGCVRYKGTDQNDWRPHYSTLTAEVISLDNSTGAESDHGGVLRLSGHFDIEDEYLNKTVDGKLSFKEPDKWYFCAYFVGKLSPDGKTVVDKYVEPVVENGHIKQIKLDVPQTLIAIDPEQKNFKLKVPITISFKKIKIDDKNNFVPFDNTIKFVAKPLGNVVNFRLKNDLVNSVYINKAFKVKCKSRLIFGDKIDFDFWEYTGRLDGFGKDNYYNHYANESGSGIFDGDLLKDDKCLLNIDWSQYSSDKKTKSKDGKDYIKLKTGDYINLYCWTMFKRNEANSSNGDNLKFSVDFSDGLDLKIPTYKYSGQTVSVDKFVSPANQYGKLGLVKLQGGADSNTPATKENMDVLDYNYFKFESEKENLFEPGKAYIVPLSIHSDITITEVYFNWKKNNDGILEIFNPNNYPVDLSNYYLGRVRYDNYNDYETNGSHSGRGEFLFNCPWHHDDKRFQYCLLMPLNLENNLELTPAGGSPGQLKFFSYDSGGYSTRESQVAHATNSFKSYSKLVWPNNEDINTKLSSIQGGMTFLYGGGGIYNNADNRNNGTGTILFNDNNVGAYLYSNTNWRNDKNPKRFAYLWGVFDSTKPDGALGSANDKESGSMERNLNQGWFIAKKVNGKFYILDTWGFASQNTLGRSNTINKSFMDNLVHSFTTTKSSFAIRKQNILFPTGALGFENEWDLTNISDQGTSIGARTRYSQTGHRPDNDVPDFLGNPNEAKIDLIE